MNRTRSAVSVCSVKNYVGFMGLGFGAYGILRMEGVAKMLMILCTAIAIMPSCWAVGKCPMPS